MRHKLLRVFFILLMMFVMVGCGSDSVFSSDNQEEREEERDEEKEEDEENGDEENNDEKIDEENDKENDKEIEEVEDDGDIMYAHDTSDYHVICEQLLQGASAHGSDYEDVAARMAQSIANSKIMEEGMSYSFEELQPQEAYALAYTLADFNRYSLTNYRESLNDSEYASYTYIYDKEAYWGLVEAFCDRDAVENYMAATQTFAYKDFNDYIGILGADGDYWVVFEGYDIKEDENYILVQADCFQGSNGGNENLYQYTINVLLEKSEESVLGLQAMYVEKFEENIMSHISSVTSSSQLDQYQNKTYGPENLVDGNYNTAWVENVDGVGIGESVQIKLDQKMWIQNLAIYNGYQDSYEVFANNGYVTKIAIDFGNGIVREMDCIGVFSGPDKTYAYLEKISLQKPVYTDIITIRILDAVAGEKYSDTCISEIELY